MSPPHPFTHRLPTSPAVSQLRTETTDERHTEEVAESSGGEEVDDGAAHLNRMFPDGPPTPAQEQDVLAGGEEAGVRRGPRPRGGPYAERM